MSKKTGPLFLGLLVAIFHNVVPGTAAVNGANVCDEIADGSNDEQDEDTCWDDLEATRRLCYEERGWTRKMWDASDDDGEKNDDEDREPYFTKDWDEIRSETREALTILGYTESLWESDDDDATGAAETKPWKTLTGAERRAAEYLGYDEESWFAHEWGTDFGPEIVHMPIPELQAINLDYLAKLDADVQLRNGDTTTDNDELGDRTTMKMKEYVQRVRKGSKLKLLYEDRDPFKRAIHSTVGEKVVRYLGEALRNSKLRQSGQYKFEYDEVELDESNWMIFVGGANSSTAMHFDDDTFNFLWIAEGRKRIIFAPNDERTVDRYICATYLNSGCWSGVDILSGPLTEHPHAVEFEMGPGDGVMIPYLAWHAVKNLEPTVAFGFRIDLPQEVH